MVSTLSNMVSDFIGPVWYLIQCNTASCIQNWICFVNDLWNMKGQQVNRFVRSSHHWEKHIHICHTTPPLPLMWSASLDVLVKNKKHLSKGRLIVNICLFSLYQCGILMPHLDFINRDMARERESEEGDKQKWDSINYMIALINCH